MHWDLSSGEVPRLLQDFPAGLLYGYNVYTTFRWPLETRWLAAHLSRLASNAEVLGLDWCWERSDIISWLESCHQPQKPVMRLSVVADVAGYGAFYDKGRLPARLILSLRVDSAPHANALSMVVIRYQRPLPGVKLGGIAELIHFKRQAF